MTARVPEPCDSPRGQHDGECRFYVTGWKCDAHAPWAVRGLPAPAPGPGHLYSYRAASADHDQTNGPSA